MDGKNYTCVKLTDGIIKKDIRWIRIKTNLKGLLLLVNLR